MRKIFMNNTVVLNVQVRLNQTVVFWHRRDLRVEDNCGIFHALNSGSNVQPIFIIDSNIIDRLPPNDKRLLFIYRQLKKLNDEYSFAGGSLKVYIGRPEEVWEQISKELNPIAVYFNHDYEPYAVQRDEIITRMLNSQGISVNSLKDQCVFEKDEVMKDNGKPYTVFTPYSHKWKQKLNVDGAPKPYPSENFLKNILPSNAEETAVFLKSKLSTTDESNYEFDLSSELLTNYKFKRDFPAQRGTSRISVHLRFGTISIRKCLELALKYSDSWLNELIWRDFYMMIIWHFPHVTTQAFKPIYNNIIWRNNPIEFEAWCNGMTGYPIVDAGMRELKETGFMHNRVRMITASFLTKHLLIDWRWGEAWFAQHLMDFELSSNNGGWQWASSSGCDAAPYFRIFNPTEQQRKFDPNGAYIRKWIPEFDTLEYPQPIVEHTFARKRALETYAKYLKE